MDRFCVTQYRSEGLPKGAFRQLGTIHLHIDGGGRVDLVRSLIGDLEQHGCPGKLTAVSHSVPGPQRLDHPETYASHTPGDEREEQLDYFSTSGIADREQGVAVMRRVLPQLSGHFGVVLELERVIATIDDGEWVEMPLAAVKAIEGREVGFRCSPTLPFEVHHAFDVSMDAGSVLRLDQLLEETGQLGVRVGGWFNFAKDREWSYRSNAFVKSSRLRECVQREHEALERYLRGKGLQYHRLWTLVEQVLGIWKIPLKPE